MNNNEIERPSALTEVDRNETTFLIEVFEKIPDETGKKIALAYLEGFAAACSSFDPKALHNKMTSRKMPRP